MKRIEPEKIYDLKILLGISVIYLSACFGCLLLYDHPLLRYSSVFILLAVSVWKRKQIARLIKSLMTMRKDKERKTA